MVTAIRPEGVKNLRGLKAGDLLDIEGVRGASRVLRSNPSRIVVIAQINYVNFAVQSYQPVDLKNGELAVLDDPEIVGVKDTWYENCRAFLRGDYHEINNTLRELRSRW